MYGYFQPYINSDEDFLAETGQYVVFIQFFLAIVVKYDMLGMRAVLFFSQYYPFSVLLFSQYYSFLSTSLLKSLSCAISCYPLYFF